MLEWCEDLLIPPSLSPSIHPSTPLIKSLSVVQTKEEIRSTAEPRKREQKMVFWTNMAAVRGQLALALAQISSCASDTVMRPDM